jgi:hypothetical protein
MPREGQNGWIRSTTGLYIPIPGGTSAVEALTDLTQTYRQMLETAVAVVTVAGTGSGANRTIRVLKGTGTVVATGTLTLANTATVGAKVALTVTDDGATNAFEDDDVLTVDFPAAGAVAFTAGAINLLLGWRTRPQQLY